jgi:hypothetical protein
MNTLPISAGLLAKGGAQHIQLVIMLKKLKTVPVQEMKRIL